MTARRNGIGIPREILGQPESASFVGSDAWHVRKRRTLHLLALAKKATPLLDAISPAITALGKSAVEVAASFQRAFASMNRAAGTDAKTLEEFRKQVKS